LLLKSAIYAHPTHLRII